MHNGGKKAEEKTALTDKQVEVLLDALKETRTHLFCMIALYAGLRREEILALKWDCIELDNVPLLAPGENRHFEPGENNQFQPGRNRQSVPGGCSQPRFECRF